MTRLVSSTANVATPRSRRAVLAGLLGGVATWVADAATRNQKVRAYDGEVVQVGGEYTSSSRTHIGNLGSTEPAISGFGGGVGVQGSSTSGTAVKGVSDSGIGLWGESQTSIGVVGSSAVIEGIRGMSPWVGVRGASDAGTGVLGDTNAGTGVKGECMWSATGRGVWGNADSGRGVYGSAVSGVGMAGYSKSGVAINGTSKATDRAAVVALSNGSSTGLLGCSGGMPASAKPKTGVYGYAAQDATSRGVIGESPAGTGVRGNSSSGVGVYGQAGSGYAIQGNGRLRFDKVSGVATIAAGGTSATVNPGVDVSSSSFVLLTPKANIGSRGLWFTTNATNNTFTIRMSSSRSSNTKVAWLLLG